MKVLHAATHFSLYVHTILSNSPGEAYAFLPERNWRAELGDQGGNPRVQLFSSGTLRTPTRLISAAWKFAAYKRALRPSVIHYQEAPTDQLRLLWAAGGLVPRMLTVHDVSPHPGRDQINRRVQRHLASMRRSAAAVVVHSSTLRRNLLNSGQVDPDRVHVIHHPALPVGAGTPIGGLRPPFALMLGRMEQYKGLQILCDALASIPPGRLGLPIVVAGAGPEIQRLGPQLRSLGANVIDRFLLPAEMDWLIQNADLLLAPYTEASASGVLAQALSVNLPILATRVGAFPEYVSEGANGWLIGPADPRGLAQALEALTMNPRLLRQTREAAPRQNRAFTPEEISLKTWNLYLQVIAGSSP